MGNQPSSTSSSKRRSGSGRETAPPSQTDHVAARAKRVVGDLQEGIKNSVKKLDDDHPAAQLIDHVCGAYFDDEKYRHARSSSYYSEEASEDGSRTFQSEDDTTYEERRNRNSKSDKSVESASYTTHSEYDYDSDSRRGKTRGAVSFDTEEESKATTVVGPNEEPKLISKPLASSFAKRCYFTKAGIGKTTQHYEGLTLTGNVVLMLASAMKLKGCPTICDEDLRRVEQTYPNQFSRLPDELLLSSGWRRISKYCHFSNKPIPDGVPFFHSKQRLHPSGGYYFLLAAAVGMVRPIDVEPLSRDTLVLLETDFPTQCDATPSVLIRDPEKWVLVKKFCFFSGGPINTEEDVYYQADFDSNPIYMLAFLSPSLTPEELYKLTEVTADGEPGLISVAEVQDVESVYDLTERDFDDLKLYHLGPCRALPQFILQPSAWMKVLPPHFLAARQQAMLRAQEFEGRYDELMPDLQTQHDALQQHRAGSNHVTPSALENLPIGPLTDDDFQDEALRHVVGQPFQREVDEEGAFLCSHSADNDSRREVSLDGVSGHMRASLRGSFGSTRMDPPDDEPPSLKKEFMDDLNPSYAEYPDPDTPAMESNAGANAFFTVDQTLRVDAHRHMIGPSGFPNQYVSPESVSPSHEQYFQETPTHDEDQYYQQTQSQGNDEYYEADANTPRNGEYYGDDVEGRHDQYVDESGYPVNEQYYAEGPSPVNGDYYAEEPPTPSNGSYYEDEPSANYGRHYDDAPTYYEDAQHVHNNDQLEPQGDEHADAEAAGSPNSKSTQELSRQTSGEDGYNGTDEKKFGLDTEDMDSHSQLDNSTDFLGKDGQTERFIDTSANPWSPQSGGLDSGKNHQSPAMRGAHEILKRNRRRRLEVISVGKPQNPAPSPAAVENPNPAESEATAGTWDDSGSDVTGSGVSGSSVWTDTSGPGDRSSRRALILQMAKARMKTTKESPSVAANRSKLGTSIMEEDTTIMTEGNTLGDIDFAGDLD